MKRGKFVKKPKDLQTFALCFRKTKNCPSSTTPPSTVGGEQKA